MSDILEETCGHDSGELVIEGDGQMRCPDCHCVMVIVPQPWLEHLLVAYRDLRTIEAMRREM